MAQTTMTFRVDDALKKDFDRLCDEFGLSNTAALTIFMKTMVRERRIPRHRYCRDNAKSNYRWHNSHIQ